MMILTSTSVSLLLNNKSTMVIRRYRWITIAQQLRNMYVGEDRESICCIQHLDSLFFGRQIDYLPLFLNFFQKRKKASSDPYNFAPEINNEVWLSGRKRHTASVLNRQVPEVRILLLPLIRLVSSVGSEHDATNVGVGSSNLSRVTINALWCNGQHVRF